MLALALYNPNIYLHCYCRIISSGALDDETKQSIQIGMHQYYRLNLFKLKRLGVDWEYIAA